MASHRSRNSHRDTLVLNSDYRPISIASRKRILTMLYLGKIEPVADDLSVVRLTRLVRKPLPNVPFEHPTRRGVLQRDAFTCAYCGCAGEELTIDHVVPRSRGGAHSWDNLVCCCSPCNHHKADRLPSEAGMTLHIQPRRPRGVFCLPYSVMAQLVHRHEWHEYLAPYLPRA